MQLESPTGVPKVKSIAACESHSLAVTEEGQVRLGVFMKRGLVVLFAVLLVPNLFLFIRVSGGDESGGLQVPSLEASSRLVALRTEGGRGCTDKSNEEGEFFSRC